MFPPQSEVEPLKLVFTERELTAYEQYVVEQMEQGSTVLLMFEFIHYRTVGVEVNGEIQPRDFDQTVLYQKLFPRLASDIRRYVREAIACSIKNTQEARELADRQTDGLLVAARNSVQNDGDDCDMPSGELTLVDDEPVH
jgi:hypothetical protein